MGAIRLLRPFSRRWWLSCSKTSERCNDASIQNTYVFPTLTVTVIQLDCIIRISGSMSTATPTTDAERQPLLASQQQDVQGSQPTDTIPTTANLEIPTDTDASMPDVLEQKTYHVWIVLWYIILVSGGTFALVFITKGFIDAGDGNVSPP
jgi:hypothetical protein